MVTLYVSQKLYVNVQYFRWINRKKKKQKKQSSEKNTTKEEFYKLLNDFHIAFVSSHIYVDTHVPMFVVMFCLFAWIHTTCKHTVYMYILPLNWHAENTNEQMNGVPSNNKI